MDEGGGGAEAGGEAVLVEAVFGPGAGVGDAASVLDGREGGLGTDGLREGAGKVVSGKVSEAEAGEGEEPTSSLRMGCSYLYLPNCSSGLGSNGGLSVTSTEP